MIGEQYMVAPDKVREALQALLDQERLIPTLFCGDTFELHLRVAAVPVPDSVQVADDGTWAVASTYGRPWFRVTEAQP